jgi:hypothetical protein
MSCDLVRATGRSKVAHSSLFATDSEMFQTCWDESDAEDAEEYTESWKKKL